MLENYITDNGGKENRPAKPEYRSRLKGVIMARTGLKTNREIAQAINYKMNAVQQVTSGKLYPSPSMQRALCELVGMKIKDLRELI